MGKSTKLLTIVLTDLEMASWPVFVEMKEQGHCVVTLNEVVTHQVVFAEDTGVDLVMGSKAHLLLPGMEKLASVAVKAARARKYPAKSKGGSNVDQPDQA